MNKSEIARERAIAYWAMFSSEERKVKFLERTKGIRSPKAGFQKGHRGFVTREGYARIREKLIGNNWGYAKGQIPWNKGKIGWMSEAGRKAISESRRNHSPWNKGIELSEEHKQKLRDARKGLRERQGYLLSPEAIEKLRKINIGHICSKETRERIGKARRGKVMGSEVWCWKGGISLGENKRPYYKIRSVIRRARKLNAEGSYTQEEWENKKAQYQYTCPACDKSEPEIQLTADHIVPLIKGGTNYIDNIQPLCQSCNSRKHTKTIVYTAQLALVSC